MSNGEVSVWQLPGNPQGYRTHINAYTHEEILAGCCGMAALEIAEDRRDLWNYGPRLLVPEQPYYPGRTIVVPYRNNRQADLGQNPFSLRALLYSDGDERTRRYGGILVVVKFPNGVKYATLSTNPRDAQGGALWQREDNQTDLPYNSGVVGSASGTARPGFKLESVSLLPTGWFYVQDNEYGTYTAEAIKFWTRYMNARWQRDPRAEGVDLLEGRKVAPRISGAAADVVDSMDADFWAGVVAAQAAAAERDRLRGEGEAMEDARAAAAAAEERRRLLARTASEQAHELTPLPWWQIPDEEVVPDEEFVPDEEVVLDGEGGDDSPSGTGMVLGLAAAAAAIFMATK